MTSKKKSTFKKQEEGTHEFFSKARKKDQDFTFSKAPLNKDIAKEEMRASSGSGKRRSAFVAKLYRDDDDL